MKTWYIIAYDIRQPKRLRRLHYYLRKRATSLQNSVFLIKAHDKYLYKLIQTLQSIANTNEDDIRIYPIHHPDTIWAAGKQTDAMQHLYAGSTKSAREPKIRKKSGWLQTLFGWKS